MLRKTGRQTTKQTVRKKKSFLPLPCTQFQSNLSPLALHYRHLPLLSWCMAPSPSCFLWWDSRQKRRVLSLYSALLLLLLPSCSLSSSAPGFFLLFCSRMGPHQDAIPQGCPSFCLGPPRPQSLRNVTLSGWVAHRPQSLRAASL